jgi:hypothetical protein
MNNLASINSIGTTRFVLFANVVLISVSVSVQIPVSLLPFKVAVLLKTLHLESGGLSEESRDYLISCHRTQLSQQV